MELHRGEAKKLDKPFKAKTTQSKVITAGKGEKVKKNDSIVVVIDTALALQAGARTFAEIASDARRCCSKSRGKSAGSSAAFTRC